MEAQTIGNIAGALLVGGYTGMRLIRFFSLRNNTPQKKEQNECPVPKGCEFVNDVSSEVAELGKEFREFKKDVYPKINRTAEGVKRIEGFIDGYMEGLKGDLTHAR